MEKEEVTLLLVEVLDCNIMSIKQFTRVAVRKPGRNTFSLNHDRKFTNKFGQLTPILCMEMLPGDRFTNQSTTLVRFAPLLAPVMHRVRVFTHYFFVPNRIIWPGWEDFISPDLSGSTTPPAWPHIALSSGAGFSSVAGTGTLGDYLGLGLFSGGTPVGSSNISALPFAAYQKIYNDYYRDENLVPDLEPGTIPLANGNNFSRVANLCAIRQRAWQHDYFTSALPFAQKGPAVELGLSGDAPVLINNPASTFATWQGQQDSPPGTVNILAEYGSSDDAPINSLFADMSSVTSTTINELRNAIRLQEFFEKAARGGTRYIEQIRMHFGVKSSDSRLQRAEFLGGNIQNVVISEVLQTSANIDDETPLATMGGHAISASKGNRISYFAEEHGFLIGIQSIMPETAYFQGLPRMWTRQSWEDYAWPTFAHLGEQEIKNKELFWSIDSTNNDGTFGYIPRYSEYRYMPSTVHGVFRTSLDFWHLARKFSNLPTLNQQFIYDKSGMDRIFAVSASDNQNIWCHVYHDLKMSRVLPKYGTPTL